MSVIVEWRRSRDRMCEPSPWKPAVNARAFSGKRADMNALISHVTCLSFFHCCLDCVTNCDKPQCHSRNMVMSIATRIKSRLRGQLEMRSHEGRAS